MTERVYLHVGAPTSGTSGLDRVLTGHRAALAEAGVLVAGGGASDLAHAGMALREDPQLQDLAPRAARAWDRLVEQVRSWHGPVAVISHPSLAGATESQVQRALAAFEGLEVHVVVTAGDLGRAVPAAWEEKLKQGFAARLEDWWPRPEQGSSRGDWGWHTLDPSELAARWGVGLPPEHVHVVTVPRQDAPAAELWRRFSAACALDVPSLDVGDPGDARGDRSLGLVAAELLRRVNEQMRAPISGPRERARWIRDTLADRVLAGPVGDTIGLTPEQLAEAGARSERAAAAVTAAGYDVQGDLDDLRPADLGARTPDEVGDAELLDTALGAVVDLLALVRERSALAEPGHGAARAGTTPAGVKRRLRLAGKGMARLATRGAVEAENRRLQQRLDQLEQQLAESRSLQRRVAELSDVVTELLLPAAHQDPEVLTAAIERYREESV